MQLVTRGCACVCKLILLFAYCKVMQMHTNYFYCICVCLTRKRKYEKFSLCLRLDGNFIMNLLCNNNFVLYTCRTCANINLILKYLFCLQI